MGWRRRRWLSHASCRAKETQTKPWCGILILAFRYRWSSWSSWFFAVAAFCEIVWLAVSRYVWLSGEPTLSFGGFLPNPILLGIVVDG